MPYLLLDGLQRFDNTTDSELEIELGAVQSADDEVHNAKVIVVDLNSLQTYRLLHLLLRSFLLFYFQPAHNIFCLFVKVDHNVAHTQVRDYDGSQVQQILAMLLYDRFVVADSFLVLIAKYKKYVS